VSSVTSKSLDAELALWRKNNLTPQIWWRDDDATGITPELKQLRELMIKTDFPVMLAVIPSLAKPDLPKFLNQEKLFSVATHGFAHYNHADPGIKKTELTENSNGRTIAAVLDELAKSRAIIERMFGLVSSQILVPPWNRISKNVLRHLPSAGFHMLSTFTDNKLELPIKQINCHIDLMEWRPERRGKDFDIIVQELVACLENRRLSRNPEEPIGILSHHLVHDGTAWQASEKLMHLISQRPEIKILSSKDLMESDDQ
jgi:hypothetical protein